MNNKTLGWIFGILVVALVIVLALRAKHDGQPLVGTDSSYTESTTEGTVEETTEDVTTGSVHVPTTGVAPVPMSYQTALSTYATTRIQFDTACQATPNAATWKVGTKIMLDNRSPEARVIHLGSIGDISVKGYGFKIVTLSLTGLGTNAIAVDCGAKQSVAIITVQK